jgi:predicted dehydrogenase
MSAMMRIGVAGAGLIGRKHVALIEASADCIVAGIADPTVEVKAFGETDNMEQAA